MGSKKVLPSKGMANKMSEIMAFERDKRDDALQIIVRPSPSAGTAGPSRQVPVATAPVPAPAPAPGLVAPTIKAHFNISVKEREALFAFLMWVKTSDDVKDPVDILKERT